MNRPGGGRAAPAPGQNKTPTADIYKQAIAHHEAGRLGRAIPLYRQVLRRSPKAVGALHALGHLMGEVSKHEQGIGLLRRAIALDDTKSHIHASLGAQLLETGHGEEALRCMRRAVELEPQTMLFPCTLAECLERLNRLDEAREVISAPEIQDDDPHVQLVRSVFDRRAGDLESARERLATLLQQDDVPVNLRSRALNESGVVLDKLGCYDEAFDVFEASGQRAAEYRVTKMIDPEVWTRRMEHYRDAFTADSVQRFSADTFKDDSLSVAFLVGSPRSGTTLTEQVMTAHPDIVSSDERELIRVVKDAMNELLDGDNDDVPAQLARLEPAQVRALRARYRDAAEEAAGSPLGQRMFLDKLPLNIVELGLINVIFPEAPIIVALRDPRDVCLSCLIQDFRINAAMAHYFSLKSTVRFYGLMMELYLHQRDLLTLNMLQVRYEDTVSDLESQARRLLEHLGKPWDPAVLSFHEKAGKRLISTPSFAAVTEPVHTRAVARWRNYEKQFVPYQEQLAPFVKAFGYDE